MSVTLLRDTYFWCVYLNGRDSRTSCPEYLKRENFEKLKYLQERGSRPGVPSADRAPASLLRAGAAQRLHRQDRVGTYASFHIARLAPAA